MICFDNVSFCYQDDSKESLSHVSFSIEEGEVVLITGLSGSGKSTVLKCINGLIPSLYEGTLSGSITYRNQPISTYSSAELNHQIGSVFQNPRSQFFTTSTLSELAFAMENYGTSVTEMKDTISRLSHRFHLQEVLKRDIFQISSGERQRLSLACSLTLGPKVLLFDEPSSNLDYAMTMEMRNEIIRFQQEGFTVLIADHRFFYLEGILDKVIVMEKGSVSGIYTETEFKNSNYPLRRFSLFATDEPIPLAYPGEDCLHLTEVSYQGILENIDFSVKKGCVTAILGKNGVGKTTLAKIISGMIKPTSGKIQAPPAMFVMQDSDYQLFGTSVENELSIFPHPVSKEDVTAALDRVGLLSLRYRHPFQLSGGEKQRLQIATAFISKNDLVIFDEPTSGLDYHTMQAVSDLISELAKNRAVLVISHDYEFLRKTANRILYLEDGKLADDFILTENNVFKIETIFHKMKGVLS